ncbi:MAG: phosphopentomutase [Armatimonadota bacterium]
MLFDRVVLIVLDGCGAGPAPDADEYGDIDENRGDTLRNVWNAAGGFETPLLAESGFLTAANVPIGERNLPPPSATFCRLKPTSKGKDSITGHWEMMGIVLDRPFPTYPNGFPPQIVSQFESAIGRPVLGNEAASGTEIIQRLGSAHVRSGYPILYTSADSVFQIACHEDIVPVETLYEWCEAARRILVAPHNVARVIARPFTGNAESGFTRTDRRRDFPLAPPTNLIDTLSEQIGPVHGIGIVSEAFAGRGFLPSPRTQSNEEHEAALLQALNQGSRFIFANFEDFDMRYGHRNDPEGFAQALERFDATLYRLLGRLRPGDLLLLTADHGNDPTTPSTDHSREYVPFGAIAPGRETLGNLGDLDGLWRVGATVAQGLSLPFAKGPGILTS